MPVKRTASVGGMRQAIGKRGWGWFLALCLMTLNACTTFRPEHLRLTPESLAKRELQTRIFDTQDEDMVLSAGAAVLQDLGFILDAADYGLGTVSGTRWDRVPMRITVSVHPRGESQMVVRANCQIERKPVQDPVPYQRFFAALSKSLFLEAQEVE